MKVLKDEHWFDFRNITILTGTNNSGKSSVINALQMLQENISTDNIDNLLQTKLKIKANQGKYGSIESFVNFSSDQTQPGFGILLRRKFLEFRLRVKIKSGIEPHGIIEKLIVKDIRTDEVILAVKVENPYPDLRTILIVNFQYFTKRLIEKCRNTRTLFERIPELEKMKEEVNNNDASIDNLKELAGEISQELSVYIHIMKSFSIDDLGDDSLPSKDPVVYIIADTDKYGDESTKLNDIKVLFEDAQKAGELVSKQKFQEEYVNFCEYDVIDFSALWEDDEIARLRFENILQHYYSNNLEACYQNLNHDLIDLLSNTAFIVEEDIEDEFKSAQVVGNAINYLLNYGLMARAFTLQDGSNLAPYGMKLWAKGFSGSIINNKVPSDRFVQEVFNPLMSIVEKSSQRGTKKLTEFISLHKVARAEIFSEIQSMLINLRINFNNLHIPSIRNSLNRSHNLNDGSIYSFLISLLENQKEQERNKSIAFVNKWLKELEIADKVTFEPDKETGQFKTYLLKGTQKILLADFGLGTNQVLTIILALTAYHHQDFYPWETNLVPRIVVIEEPEANLHPAMQSKLADMFCEAIREFKIKILIETHSEYLVRKLQYLIARGDNKGLAEDVIIHYFYKPDHQDVVNKKVSQVERIEIDKFGRLTKNFGQGFYDEADNIAIELFLLPKRQDN